MNNLGSPNPNFNNFSYFPDHNIDHHQHQSSEFELSDYLLFDDHHHGFDEDAYSSQSKASSDKIIMGGSSSGATSEKNNMQKMKMEVGQRFAFRTKSELEVMDDGFKWRKYGKKSVKNSPNPRNYYKCSTGGCQVKKRVERDREDSSYVITTYEGTHNHESPCVVYDYYNHHQQQMPQNGWTLQPNSSSSPPSSSSS
ncbi:WRKY domain-containing protein [Citrus sinensis]|nr:WRKY domain-containing protein [Citrus sinensis]